MKWTWLAALFAVISFLTLIRGPSTAEGQGTPPVMTIYLPIVRNGTASGAASDPIMPTASPTPPSAVATPTPTAPLCSAPTSRSFTLGSDTGELDGVNTASSMKMSVQFVVTPGVGQSYYSVTAQDGTIVAQGTFVRSVTFEYTLARPGDYGIVYSNLAKVEQSYTETVVRCGS